MRRRRLSGAWPAWSPGSSCGRAPVLLSCLLGHLGGLLVSGAAGQARVEVMLLLPPLNLSGVSFQMLLEPLLQPLIYLNVCLLSLFLIIKRYVHMRLYPFMADPEPLWCAGPHMELLSCLLKSRGKVGDTDPKLEDDDSWIGVIPVGEEQAEVPRGSREESFTTTVVNKMKRALVFGASALLILALNQNAIREMDVPQVLSKPVVIVQTSENVTKLLGALLRGLRATAKITYQAVLLENVGVTLTLWSTCGLSRGGLYGEWQGVICTGETSSRVQKYLQQLWNAILLIALILCTGVIMQAQRQSRHSQLDDDSELDLKQHIAQKLSALKTRRYHPGKPPRSWAHEIDSCAICLDHFHKNQCLRVLPCLHEFHRDCVDPWLFLQQTCPLCKHNILGNCCQES
nr:RING finger protein 215 [Pogona vitticeps]